MASQPVASPPLHPDAMLDMTETTSSHAYRRDQQPQRSSSHVASSASLDYVAEPRRRPQGSPPAVVALMTVMLIMMVLACVESITDSDWFWQLRGGPRGRPISFLPSLVWGAEATAVRYRGGLYRGITEEDFRRGGQTFSMELAIPAFPSNETLLREIMAESLTQLVRIVDQSGNVYNSMFVNMDGHMKEKLAENNISHHVLQWQSIIPELVERSDVEVGDGGRLATVTFAPSDWSLPPGLSLLVVPCLTFSIFGSAAEIELNDMPMNCLSGDPFLIRHEPMLQVVEDVWSRRGQLVTGRPIEVPIRFHAAVGSLDRLALERGLRVVEGTTCLHSRNAFVRGSMWDPRAMVYRFTPHRGGVQTLCFMPFPDTYPLVPMRIKLMDSYEVAGPEGASTDPPQVRVEQEFSGTIYGTNLTTRDTAVMTDELCTDFSSQNVFFVELFFSSPTRVSFYGKFHRRGIYHICYHHADADAYVRVTTLLVEKGREVTIDGGTSNVLIDQDVRLVESASVTRLKVQNKGHLDLKKRSLNVSFFLWSGGSITGKGVLNCTGYSRITTEGYETRLLSVPLHNYGDMTIDVQRLFIGRDGAIHNYGNLTLLVSSLGMDGISSAVSHGKRNVIHNHHGGTLRIMALDKRSYALLTCRLLFSGGRIVLIGPISLTDVTAEPKASIRVSTSAAITGYSMRLACPIQLEEGSSLTLMEGSALSVAEVFGTGELIIRGDGVMLDSLLVHDQVSVLVDGVQNNHSITVSVYGTCEFGEGTFVRVVSATFATSTGLAKMMFAGVVIASIGQTRFSGNMIIQASGVCVVYSAPLPGGAAADWVPTVASLFVPPRATLFAIDARFMNDGTSEAEAEAEAVASALAPAGQTALCSSFIALSEYLTLGGRLLLHGCVSIPLGGTFSGAVARMSDVDDSTWSTLQATCDHFLAHMEVPPYCSPSSRPPPAMRTGLSTGNELHIRQGASFALDEFTLLSGVMRVVDRLSMDISGQASINGGTRLLIGDGGSIRAKKVIINGSVEIGTPSLTAIVAEEVELLEEGVVVLSRTSKSSCEEAVVAVFGSLDPLTAHPDAVHCLQSPDSAEADLRHHPADISDSSGKNLYIAMFHTGLACPTDVVDEMQSLGNILSAFFHTRSYYPIDSIPSRSGMLWFFFISVVASVAIFLLLLHAWKSSFRGWVREMQIRPPLHLTLTWDEFSYNIFNYVTFSSVVLVGVQNMVAVFHPGIPVPVPFAASFGLRSMHLVMPHHRMSKCHSYVVSFLVLAWGAATYTWFGTSEEAARRRGQLQRKGFLLTVLMAITNIVTILLSMLHVPIFSMLLDGVACRTILRDLPTCQKFRDDGIFALIFALISVVVCVLVVPWNMVVSQIPISRVELRIRGFWTFVIVAMEVLEVSLWKVFYSSPIPFVFSCVAFQLSLVGLCVWSAPTAYENINRFYTLSAMIPLMVYVWLLFYCYQAKMGHLSSCLDYDTSFKMVLCCVGLAYLANFWRNILSVRYSMESSGDVNIDSLKQSVEQIASRIQDLKVILFSANERTDRESTLNAIARLRLEYLEKQECYRFGTARLLREFNFGSHFSDLAQRAKASSPFSPYELPLRTDSSDVSAFSLENAHLLSSSFSQTSHGLLTVDEMETFKCGPTLGKGSYGTVHMGIISSNAMLVAVKYVNVANESKEYLTSVKAEVDTLRELSHPNIIRYYGAHTMDDTMMVFMEFAMGGSLTSIVRKFTALTEQVMQLYTYQILCGLQYLHGKGVVHRDIKGENILIDGNGIAKLADFGCSKSLANIANGSQVGCGTLVGSPFWMAPEVIRNEAYGTKADIWSVGCTVVEMLNGGEPPWREEFDNVYSAMYFVGSTTGIPPIPDDTSEPCRQFLHRCFERDVAKRATAEELLQHPWLAAVSVSSARVRTPDVDGISSSPSFRAAMGLSPVSSAADSLFGEGSLRRRYATNGSKESLTNHSGAPRSSGNHSTPPESAPASGSATTTAATAAASPTLRKDQ